MEAASVGRVTLDSMPEPLQERLRPRVERLGYLGEFFQIAAHQPEALIAFIDFTEALKSALPFRTLEAIALTIAARTANDYELVQHENLALRGGMAPAEIRALTEPADTAPADLPSAERAAIDLARETVGARGTGARAAFGRLLALTSEEYAVGCLMTAARYLAHSTLAKTWAIEPPVPSLLRAENNPA